MVAEIIALLVLGILGIGAYYSFVLFPRQYEFRKRQEMARSLVEGDEVITGGGLVGRVMKIESDKGVAYVELADGLQVRVVTAALIDRYDPEAIARDANIGREEQEDQDEQREVEASV